MHAHAVQISGFDIFKAFQEAWEKHTHSSKKAQSLCFFHGHAF